MDFFFFFHFQEWVWGKLEVEFLFFVFFPVAILLR